MILQPSSRSGTTTSIAFVSYFISAHSLLIAHSLFHYWAFLYLIVFVCFYHRFLSTHISSTLSHLLFNLTNINMPRLHILLALSFLSLAQLSDATFFQGEVVSTSSLVYLGKFVFPTSGGNLSCVTTPLSSSPITDQTKLILYPDAEGVWQDVMNGDVACQDIVDNSYVSSIGDQFDVAVVGKRPHFWYFALVNCYANSDDGTTMIAAQYTLHAESGGDVFYNEVSWDQQGIAEISIVFFILYLVVCVPLLVLALYKTKTQPDRPLYSILLIAVVSQIISLLLALSYQAVNMENGTINIAIDQASWWFDTFSQLALLTFVYLISIGYPFVQPKLKENRRFWIFVAPTMLIYLILYVASFATFYQWQELYPSSNVYQYDFTCGYLLSILRVLTLIPLYSSLDLTIKGKSELQSLYIRFVFFACLWIVSFPVITLIAAIIDSWWRAKTVYGMNCCVTFFAVTVSYMLFHPYHSNYKFSQMQDSDSDAVELGEASTMDVAPEQSSTETVHFDAVGVESH